MKKFYIISLSLIFIGGINAQSILDTNNAKVCLSDNGTMFSSGGFLPGYEIPKGSGLHTIYSAAMWYGGVDANGQLKMANNSLGTTSQDVWPGPLTMSGTAYPLPTGSWTQTMWTVTKAEIEQHVLNFLNPGYIVPADIASWPAHGDVALGFDFYLVPFVDLNNDGNYNALDGDYPCI
jgi:hypothetical protein|tara:strand:+ start:9261 stop:9794 length:534 start_codon:yes stop_codon:yes gene_type:complete